MQQIVANLNEAKSFVFSHFQNASSTVAEAILKSQQKISLKCLSAQAVKRHKLSYLGQVPETLETFIELHGP